MYSASPGSAENTMRAIYAIAHDQPCAEHAVVTWLIHWLYRYPHWPGTVYTDAAIPVQFQLEGCEPAWCADMPLLHTRVSPE